MLRPVLILACLAAQPALACPDGAKCIGTGALNGGGASALFRKAPVSSTPASRFAIGDRLPDDYMMLTNTEYYGLPPARDGWSYFRVEHRLFRVDRASREILEDATHEANRAF
jgi:hypothetical protein